MATIDEFKQKIQTGQIFEALTLALSESVELEITTTIFSDQDINPPPDNYLRTHLNLIAGEINNQIGTQFINDTSYQELIEFHLQQVKQGNQLVLNNLESLQKMFMTMSKIMSELELSDQQRQVE